MQPVLAGFLAGLSVGVFCIGTCLPVFLPILMAQKRNLKSSIWISIEFSLGRLLGYLTFGFLIGWLGSHISSQFTHTLIALATIWTGVLMIIFSLGLINQKLCSYIPIKKIKWPILLGFLTGVNLCPPFLASLGYIFNLQNVISGLLYFLAFFFATSIYIIPASLLGIFTQANWVRNLAKVSGVIVGLYFVTTSILIIIS